MNSGDMNPQAVVGVDRTIVAYLTGFALLYIGFVTYSYLEWRQSLAIAALALPLGVIIIAIPRVVVYQYIFFLFIHVTLVRSVPLNVIDISAVAVILAAIADVLVRNRLPRRLPNLTMNFAVLLAALTVSAACGYNPIESLRPIARILFLLLTLLAIYRLSGHLEVKRLLALYFWLTVAHSVVVLTPFIMSGGSLRSFGFAWAVFDELSMLAVPIGLVYYLWSAGRNSWIYLAGTGLVFLALLATQSRAPIIFAVASIVLVLWETRRYATRRGRADASGAISIQSPPAARRVKSIVWMIVCLGFLVVVVSPGVLTALGERFERLFTLSPGGTFAIRLVLWKWALIAFSDHPIFGIGPGVFRSLETIYPGLHMTPLHYYVRFLSAHNLTLHYLAETGLVGALALLSLFINQFRIARLCWKRTRDIAEAPVGLAIYATGFLFLITTLIEAGWMWGQTGFIMTFFLAIIARSYRNSQVLQ